MNLSKLTKKELLHIIESTDAMEEFNLNVKRHAEWRKHNKITGYNIEPCFECKHICYKLGLPT